MIAKIKDFIKEHSLLIVALLIIVIMLKSCGVSRAERRFEYSKQQYMHQIDSMANVINDFDANIKQYKDSLYIIHTENEMLKSAINDAKQDKEFYKRVNRDLVNVVKNESNTNK